MEQQTMWQTPVGEIRGFQDRGVVRALGIPYAVTTRFALPQPHPGFEEPFEATTPCPVHPQVIDPINEPMYFWNGEPVAFAEDNTRLSITLPADMAAGERLPVMVWIHGGSYVTGGSDMDVYDPRLLVAEHRVIVVGINYRMGVQGFLARPGVPANLGLFDQVEALRWVRRNIASFGGDDGNITIFGESAGADSVANLMVAEGAEGLFGRAILQSPPLGVMPKRGRMIAAMAEAVGDVGIEASLEDVTAAEVRGTAAAFPFGVRGGMPYGVQYGAAPLPAEKDLPEAFRRAALRVDVLIGTNEREGAFSVDQRPEFDRATALPVVGDRVKETAVAALTQIIYASPVRAFAKRHHDAGGHGYRYLFRWGDPDNFFRAFHTAELALLLGDLRAWESGWAIRGMSDEDRERDGRRLRSLWADFARTGRLQPQRIPGLIDIMAL